jgi:hypothetical protein
MSFLLEWFKGIDLKDPIDPNLGLDLKSMATAFAEQHKAEKSQSTEEGLSGPRALPWRASSRFHRKTRQLRPA